MRASQSILLLALLFGGCQPEPIQVQLLSPAAPQILVVGEPLWLTGEAVTLTGAPAWGATLSWTSSLQGDLGSGALLPVWLGLGVHRITVKAVWGVYFAEAATTVLVRPPPQNPWSYIKALATAPLAQSKSAQELLEWTYQNLPQFLLGSPPQIPPSIVSWYAAHPTNVNSAIGNGRLTAGISSRGVLTVLRWPSPGHPDHMEYLATDYDKPEMGALPDLGAFSGIRYSTATGGGFTWFRDPAWTITQAYLTDESNAVRTTYLHPSLGITVRQTDFVVPSQDVLVRRFSVELAPGSPVGAARIVHHQNLAPCTYRIPRVPLTDWLLDCFNDFAVLHHAGENAIVHFRPAEPDYAPLLAFALQPQPDVDAFVDSADATFGPGVYFAMGADSEANVHCGTGAYSFVRGSSTAEQSLQFVGGAAEAGFFFAAGPSASTARSRLAWARGQGAASLLAQEEAWWNDWISTAEMPNVGDPQTLRVCKRGLISIRTATAESGAIVASIASQPPYSADWPRDGAFLNLALDLAGYHDLVTKHNLFYVSVQRTGFPFAGSYEMNYWADGMAGGPVFLEIDQVGTTTWTLWSHAAFLNDPQEKAAYLAQVYPAIRKGAEFLTTWKDPSTGLPAPANEDDNPAFTQGVQGAVAAVLGLKAAIAAAQEVGDSASIPAWEIRSHELQNALLQTFASPYGLPPAPGGVPGSGMRGACWFLWPAEILPADHPSMASQAQALWQATSPFFDGSPGLYAYNAEHLLALAHFWKPQGTNQALLLQALERLTHDLPTPGTNHYGETYRVDAASIRNLNDIPHVWHHALVYLAARKILE